MKHTLRNVAGKDKVQRKTFTNKLVSAAD